jgi:hypothetical protein
MSMILGCIRLSETNANLLLQHPKLIHQFLGGAEVVPLPAGGKGELPVLEPREEGDEASVDKAWQAIHYLLTGTAFDGAFPAYFLLQGGSEVGAEDVGLGPARLFKPGEVAQIHAMLQRETEVTLRARYDPKGMDASDVYPGFWVRDSEEAFSYLAERFSELQEFVEEIVRKQQCLLLFLC